MKTLESILEGWKYNSSYEQGDNKFKIKTKHENLVSQYNGYSEDHKEAMKQYKDGSGVNSYLWQKHKGEPYRTSQAEKQEHENHIDNLDSAMDVHKTPHKLVVYSGTKHDPRKIMNKEGVVHHPAYLSTSLDREVGENFSQDNLSYNSNQKQFEHHVLKIHVPKGHPGIPIRNNDEFKDEHEFLLPRGINLRHIKTESRGERKNAFYKNTYHIHHMKVVNDQ